MKGSEARIRDFLEGADKRFVIPVYQRKYDWKEDNCRQLYEDLKKIVVDKRESHFFGSIVSSVVGNGAITEYHIIDGQQRLTTVTLLLLAIRNLIRQGRISSRNGKLDEQIYARFLASPWADEDDRIKLRPVKSDRAALTKLFGEEEEFDPASNLTLNYRFFCGMLLREEVPVDDLYAAIGKLEIISITLEHGDHPQLIFESLNSTGLALTEGDKIRNYMLMDLSPRDQNRFYDKYWVKIEERTANDVSGFVRDYLSVKQQITPNISNVYRDFKAYAEEVQLPVETLLKDLVEYAGYFEKLRICRGGLKDVKTGKMLDDCLYRLKRLEIIVTRPFFLEVLRLHHDGKLEDGDVLKIFLITENYLFRRNICDVPTNALNKVFLNLNKEILRYDNTPDHYVDKFIYALRSKKESSRFPDDTEFTGALSVKQVYQMRGRYKAYLFERFENYDTIETKDVYRHLDNNIYTIEHIMPQHLTPSWTESLGVNAEEIHEVWLHRLANLTLTGYNPSLSNKTFPEKRDAEEGGYKASGLRMNQKIAMKDSWGLPELEERNEEMLSQAIRIWELPSTRFTPTEKEFDSCTLDDDSVDLTGRDIVRYSYLNTEQPVSSWTDMFEHVVQFLHQKDRRILSRLTYDEDIAGLSSYIRSSEDDLRSALKIDDGIYIEKNVPTMQKMTILRKLFALYDADPMDLVFYLRDEEGDKAAEVSRFEIRKRYWTYALPIIQKQNERSGFFSKVTPGTSNGVYGTFGISGFSIGCIANMNEARVDFCMSKSSKALNSAAFDTIYAHKNEIEEELGADLIWNRADELKGSWITCLLEDVSILHEEDWPRMARFHAEWSDKLCSVILPYLSNEEEDISRQRSDVAVIVRRWAEQNPAVHVGKSNQTHIRFTTDNMSNLLPDIKNAPSGWNTDNHYFYEIVNRTGRSLYIQFVISSKNITEEFRETCDQINSLYPARRRKWEWLWRNHYRTRTVSIDGEPSEEEIFAGLDACLEEIQQFEVDLLDKLENGSELSGLDGELLYLTTKNAYATGMITTDGFVVLKGAHVNEETIQSSLNAGMVKLRNRIFEEGKVVNLVTIEDISFSSPSAAADFVLGYSVSGPKTWKDKEGRSLKELENEASGT